MHRDYQKMMFDKVFRKLKKFDTTNLFVTNGITYAKMVRISKSYLKSITIKQDR